MSSGAPGRPAVRQRSVMPPGNATSMMSIFSMRASAVKRRHAVSAARRLPTFSGAKNGAEQLRCSSSVTTGDRVMSLNALLQIDDGKTPGECKQPGFEKWIELQSWDWELEAETSWTKGGGASVGKTNPG